MAKLKVNSAVFKKNAALCKKQGIILPTFKQMKDPDLIPEKIKKALKPVGLWDIKPINLFRINWKNDVKTGLFGGVNYLEIPRELTGIKARVIGLVGKYFPTGAHKVGACYGCLAPRMVTGEFDAQAQKAVWPSTGNYCRGGAFDSRLLGTRAVAILPEGMSKERFTWLKSVGAEVIATPGTESNVKEIYDKCWELRKDPYNVIFNQFDEFGNPIWHYQVTGPAIQEVFEGLKDGKLKAAAYVSATGSAGTIAAGDYLRKLHPHIRVVATEAQQCPTLYLNGFGGHRIEGIGDKHVPWVHNVRNTDAVAAVDDEDCMRVLRLFNEPAGHDFLKSLNVSGDTAGKLPLLGISSICNLLASIKAARYYEMEEQDVILTVFTDSMELYGSRVREQAELQGSYDRTRAARDYEAGLAHMREDWFRELNYRERKQVHNLKYYTWVEQQGKTYEEILAQWEPEYWRSLFEDEVGEFDRLIGEFNQEVGIA